MAQVSAPTRPSDAGPCGFSGSFTGTFRLTLDRRELRDPQTSRRYGKNFAVFSLVLHRSPNRENGQQFPGEQQVWLEQDFLNKASFRARGRQDVNPAVAR